MALFGGQPVVFVTTATDGIQIPVLTASADVRPPPLPVSLSAESHRVAGLAPCSHRPPCPGCPRYGEPGIAPAAFASLQALAAAHRIDQNVAVTTGATSGFRQRARLAIRGRPGSPRLGMFELGSHRVVTMPNCVIHDPLINRVAAVVRRALVDADVSPYVESTHRGVVRYLQVVVERASGTAQVVVVGNTATAEPLAAALELIRDRLGDELHSLWFNSQCARTNAILGAAFERWCGPESVIEHFGGAAVHYPPGAFGQNNLEIAGSIVDHVRQRVPHGVRVAEFYAGVGALGLSMLDRVQCIHMNEVAPQSLHGLSLGLAALDAESRRKVHVVAGPAAANTGIAKAVDVVIADPPRKGLDAELKTQLLADPPPLFIYVSCGLASFLADTAQLTGTGRLRLAGLHAFNLMPYTEHVETVACFERR
jgi:23S rRNA (uracil1939-C5)-methyltransferase